MREEIKHMTNKETTDKLRNDYTEALAAFLSSNFDTDVCRTAAGTLMLPAVDANGDDRWIKISIIVPKEATEEAGTDGYSLAEEYNLKLEAAAERKLKREKESAAKKSKTKSKT